MDKKYEIGDVVLVKNYVFQKGGKQLDHYFIIMNESKQNDGKTYYGFSISSQESYRYDRRRRPISNDDRARLFFSKQSYVNCSYLFPINSDNIIYKKDDKISLEAYIKYLTYYINNFGSKYVKDFRINHFLIPVFNENNKKYIFLKHLDGILYYRKDLKDKLETQLEQVSKMDNNVKETQNIIRKLLHGTVENKHEIIYKNIKNILGRESKKVTNLRECFSVLSDIGLAKKIEDDLNLVMPNLSYTELDELLNDFYSEIFVESSENRQLFKEMFSQRSEMVYFLNQEIQKPRNIYLPFDKSIFMIAKVNNTLEDFPNLVMQYGMGLQNLKNYHKSMISKNYVYTKIVGVFFKLLSLNYLRKSEYSLFGEQLEIDNYNKNITDSILILKKFKLAYLWQSIDGDRIPNSIQVLIKEINKILKNTMAVSENDIIKFFEEEPNKDLSDILGYLFALELFKIYQKDSERAMHILDELLNVKWNCKSVECFEQILHLGIFPCKSLNEYREYIINPIK